MIFIALEDDGFVADNNDKMHGFYRSEYKSNGEKKHILTTHFEPIDARTAFPCFDEPEFKATLDVILRVDNDLDTISNMPQKKVKKLDGILSGKKDVYFSRTPKMSTYLLYAGVGHFESSAGRSGKTKLRVVAVPGKSDELALPRKYAGRILRFYERYFGVEFPLPKIDFIAVPDFPMGAMENWGAITFRESHLLCNEKSPELARNTAASVIAHELAHQWFGNLVTMAWWDDLWLNESFATLMADKALDSLFPKLKTGIRSIPTMFGRAFSYDELINTHPVGVKVDSAEESNALFDAISYSKGGSILHMIEDYVGRDVFRDGLRHYMQKHKYSNATRSDLWDAISDVAVDHSVDIKRIMKAWVEQPGYPIVYVSRREDGKFVLRQRRFLRAEDADGKWPIPVHYKTNKGEGFLLLDESEKVLDLGADWIKLNYGQHGFYRVSYERSMVDKLAAAIQAGDLSALDAWGIENDLFALVRGARVPASEYMNFAKRFAKSSEYPIASSIISSLGWLLYQHKDHGDEDMKSLRVSLGFSLLERLTLSKSNDDTSLDIAQRNIALSALGGSGVKSTINKARSMFEAYVNTKNIDPDLRGTIYSIVAMNGGQTEYERLISCYNNAADNTDKLSLLVALGSFRDPAIIKEALEFAHSSAVRPQDSFRVATGVIATQEGLKSFWDWLRPNWQSLKARYGEGAGLLSKYVELLSATYDTKQKEEISLFFADQTNMREDIKSPLKQALERIDLNIRYRKVNGLQ